LTQKGEILETANIER